MIYACVALHMPRFQRAAERASGRALGRGAHACAVATACAVPGHATPRRGRAHACVQEQLKKCAALIEVDYFLTEKKAAFMEQARMAVFEVYCRIHQCINLDALAKQVGMEREAAELWIANLIRSAQLDARIDSAAGTIVMGTTHVDPLDAIIERTNNLSVRTFKVANALVDASQRPAAMAS